MDALLTVGAASGAAIAVLTLLGLLWRISRRIDRAVELAEEMAPFMEYAQQEFRLIWWVLGREGIARPSKNPFGPNGK